MTATLDHNMIDHPTHTMSAYRLSCFVRGWENTITVATDSHQARFALSEGSDSQNTQPMP